MNQKAIIIKAIVLIFIFTAVGQLIFVGCKKEIDPDLITKMDEIIVNSDFNYDNTKMVSMKVILPEFVEYSQNMKVVGFFTEENPENPIYSAVSDEQGQVVATLDIPSFLDSIYVHSVAGWEMVDLSDYSGYPTEIILNYNDGYNMELPPDSAFAPVHPEMFSMKSGGPNLVGNGDFAVNELGSALWVGWPYELGGPWKVSPHIETVTAIIDEVLNVNFSTVPHPNGCMLQRFSANPGDEIVFSFDGYKDRRSLWAAMYVYMEDVNRKRVNYIARNLSSSKMKTKTMVGTMPNDAVYCEYYLWIGGAQVGDHVQLDNITAYKTNTDDADGDGVVDDEDAYPNDANKVANSYYPAGNEYGTLAFEDLWPSAGDYDFNDLVIDYRFNYVRNANNDVVELDVKLLVRAIGASIRNGFGFQLDVTPDKIASVTTDYSFSSDQVSLASNGTENGQALATIIAFEDPFILLPHPGSGQGVNTSSDAPFVEPGVINMQIVFTEPQNVASIGNAPANPFIFREEVRGHEVHLPGYPPTDLADRDLFGTGDDATNLQTEFYYKTANGLPWAMNLPKSFVYPTEKTPVIEAHLKFKQWAVSGGFSFMDWYENVEGYRENTKLYTKTN